MSVKPFIETFFYIGSEKLSLIVFKDKNQKIFEKELLNTDPEKKPDELIDFFLSENILKIEKKINKFINEINLIIFDPNFVQIKASIKKKNFENKINKKDLDQMLFNLKQQIKENNSNKSIIHMRINNFIVDKKKYLNLDDNFECNVLCLEVDFICLPHKIIDNFSNKIKKYQISLNKIFSIDYLNERYNNFNLNECQLAAKLKYENDDNEVHLIKRNKEKLGFFEIFFKFFN